MAKQTACLSADQIRGAKDFKIESVEVPAWGGTVHVRSIPLRDLQVFYDASNAASTGTFGPMDMARIVAITLCDQDGNRLFSDAEVNDLAAKDPESLRLVFDKAVVIIGLSKAAVDDQKKD